MTQHEAQIRLIQLKYTQDLDVYYKVKLLTNNVWVLENRINKHNILTDKNQWTGFTNFVTPNDDGTFTVRCYYARKDKEYKHVIFQKNNVPIQKCIYWMKQFYSAVRIILRNLDEAPNSPEEFEDCEAFDHYYNKLKYLAETNSNEDLTA